MRFLKLFLLRLKDFCGLGVSGGGCFGGLMRKVRWKFVVLGEREVVVEVSSCFLFVGFGVLIYFIVFCF